MNPEDLWTEVATYIDDAYDLEKVENIYIAGDGASWIKGGTQIIKDSKFVLDHYHLSKYIKILTAHLGSLENPVHIDKPLWKNIRTGNKKFTIELINFAIEETPSEIKKERMKKAKNYILNNWEGIINLFTNLRRVSLTSSWRFKDRILLSALRQMVLATWRAAEAWEEPGTIKASNPLILGR
jgi:hypothetical protein